MLAALLVLVTMLVIRCETCGEEQEMNILDDSQPQCEHCGGQNLTQIEEE